MAKQYNITNLVCPHCGIRNSMVSALPLYGHKEHILKCWNSEDQNGCNKEFEVQQVVNIGTDFTKEQKNSGLGANKTQNSWQFKM